MPKNWGAIASGFTPVDGGLIEGNVKMHTDCTRASVHPPFTGQCAWRVDGIGPVRVQCSRRYFSGGSSFFLFSLPLAHQYFNRNDLRCLQVLRISFLWFRQLLLLSFSRFSIANDSFRHNLHSFWPFFSSLVASIIFHSISYVLFFVLMSHIWLASVFVTTYRSRKVDQRRLEQCQCMTGLS